MNLTEKDKKILIVDDEELCRNALSNLAKKAGFTSDLATNGSEAYDMVKEGNTYLLILIDIIMPGVNGYKTAEMIRGLSNGSEQTLVAMSGDGLSDEELKNCGFNIFLKKPITKKLFESLISPYKQK